MLIKFWGSSPGAGSPGAVWTKALGVTDVEEDGSVCVEAAWGLRGLLGGGGGRECSSMGKGLDS